MKYFCYGIFVLGWVSFVSIAQAFCDIPEDAVLAHLADCADSLTGSLCHQTTTMILDIDTEAETANAPLLLTHINTLRLSSRVSSTETDVALATLHLNQAERSLRIMAYGDVLLENTAARHTIIVRPIAGVNLRSTPSVDAQIIASLPARIDYVAIGRLQDNTWLQIRLDDGRIGWVSAQYLRTSESFTQLETVTPNRPVYLPMQALTLTVEDCGGIFLIAPEDEATHNTSESNSPETDVDDTLPAIFNINGAQLTVTGIVHVTIADDTLLVRHVTGQQIINAFGFETSLQANQQTTIPLTTTGMLAGVPSAAQTNEAPRLSQAILANMLAP